MRKATLAALAAGAALLGCPIPQPLPDYPAGTITPPRILVDLIDAHGTPLHLVPAGCETAPTYPLTATLLDNNNIEAVEARWFVNYDGRFALNYNIAQTDPVPADPNPLILTRTVPPPDPVSGDPRFFVFRPYQYPAVVGAPPVGGASPPYRDPGVVRVVELVVSNSFDPDADSPVVAPTDPLPNRTASPGFETQVYRWVFLTVQGSPGCTPGDPGCVTCPLPP